MTTNKKASKMEALRGEYRIRTGDLLPASLEITIS